MSLSIGIIYVGFQCEDLIQKSLTPWINARSARLGGVDWKIAAVSVPFEGFNHGDEPMDQTHKILLDHATYSEIDYLTIDSKPMKETEARGVALHALVTKFQVDILWMVDADEDYSLADIHAILTFVKVNPWVAWFRVSLKNMVFTERQYLREPFTPPRIHRVYLPGLRASGFWDDNNVYYKGGWDHSEAIQRDIDFASLTIPENVAWITHFTWLSDDRSRRKVEYQLSRGWCPSFKWDYVANRLEWNPEYYARHGLPFPPELDDIRSIPSDSV